MASRKEEKEALRQRRLEKEAADKQSDRKRLTVAYVVAAVVVVAVAVGIFVVVGGGSDSGASGEAHINLDLNAGSTNGVQPDERVGTPPPAAQETDLTAAAKAAGCKLSLKLKDEGHQHIPPSSKTPSYETNPPTSGPHVDPPYQQADGAYSETPQEINVVHALEHGRLAIQYSPDLAAKDQLALKGLYDTEYGAALLFPNDKMPYEVAATTWTNMITCPTYKGAATLDAIRAFGIETWGKFGGEPATLFGFSGPTPGEPEES